MLVECKVRDMVQLQMCSSSQLPHVSCKEACQNWRIGQLLVDNLIPRVNEFEVPGYIGDGSGDIST